jgi:hypothetical protein
VARPESWTPGPQPKSWAPHGRWSRAATEELRKVGLSNRLGSRSDRQPLFCGRSDCLGSRSDRQPLFRGRSDRLGSRSDRQQRPAVESPVEHGAPTVVRA